MGLNDSIPQLEVTSVNFQDGTIKLGFAGGIQVNENTEWISLIPLNDGTHQYVHCFTIVHVTGPMDKLYLVPLLEQNKRDNPSNIRIQNLTIPELLGGEISMILGIKYQNLFPVHIPALPKRLTVYESRHVLHLLIIW